MYIPSIPLVWDNQTKKDVPTDYLHQYFTEHQISHIRRKNTEERRYVCYLCRQPVKLQARKNETLVGGHRYYFKHSPNSRCEWKSPELTKADVYKGVQEGKQHFELKQLLQNTLSQLQDWDNAGADDKYFWDINHINRRKPDVYAAYHNQTIVFEIQLRSENPQTINERQNFYRNENIPLVWFSLENSELVNDEHQSECLDVKQVQKDIAFSNNGNWYIFNESLAQQSFVASPLNLRISSRPIPDEISLYLTV